MMMVTDDLVGPTTMILDDEGSQARLSFTCPLQEVLELKEPLSNHH